MSFIKQTRRKTYSSKNVNERALHSSKLFDQVIGEVKNQSPARQAKTSRRPKTRKTKQVSSGKQLSLVDEKEDKNDSSSLMIFNEKHTKKHHKKTKVKVSVKKNAQRRKRPRGNVNKSQSDNGEKFCGDASEYGELCVETVEASASKNVKMIKRKHSALAVSKRNKRQEKRNSVELNGENGNIYNQVRKDFNDSIEIARECTDLLPCKLPFGQRSPVLLIKESDGQSSEEDSVLDGDDSSDESIDFIGAKDNGTQSIPTTQQTESSKYTYSYVSTYTYGTSTRSQTRSAHSPYVPLKNFSKLNSTTKSGKDNINDLEFPAILSPIYSSSVMTSVKDSSQSDDPLTRKQTKRKELNTSEENAVYQPPKCSTMLFASETADSNFGFPLTLTGIEGTQRKRKELRSVKDSSQSDGPLARKQTKRKELNTREENAIYQPPKCSTKLFPSETADSNFGFPLTLTGIEVTQRKRKELNTSEENAIDQPPKCSTKLFPSETADSNFGFPLTLTGIEVPQRKRKELNTSEENAIDQPPKCSTKLFPSETADSNFGFPLTLTGIEVPQRKRKELNTSEENAIDQPPKRSTKLFASDSNFGFPVPLTGIEDIDTPHYFNADNGDSGIPGSSGVRENSLTRSRKKQKPSSEKSVLGVNENNKQGHLLDENGNNNSKTNRVIPQKYNTRRIHQATQNCRVHHVNAVIDDSLKQVRDSHTKTLPESVRTQKQTHQVSVETSASCSKKPINLLKSLKRRAYRCFSSVSGKDKENNRTARSDSPLHDKQPTGQTLEEDEIEGLADPACSDSPLHDKQATGQTLEEEENEGLADHSPDPDQICVSGHDRQLMLDVRGKAAGEKSDEIDICCINRLCMSLRPPSRDKGQLCLTFLNKS